MHTIKIIAIVYVCLFVLCLVGVLIRFKGQELRGNLAMLFIVTFGIFGLLVSALYELSKDFLKLFFMSKEIKTVKKVAKKITV